MQFSAKAVAIYFKKKMSLIAKKITKAMNCPISG